MIIGRAIVTDLCDAKGSARTFSTLQVIMTLGPIIAPILGGSIITFGGWRPVFAFMLAFGLLCLLLVWRFIPETLPEAARHDRSNSESVLSTWRGLLARRAFVVPMVVGGIGQASMFAFITGSPFVFMGLHGATSRQYGFLFALIALSLIVFAQVNRVALKRYSPQTMLSVALTMTVAGALLSVLAVSTNSLVVLVATLWVAIGALGFLGANAVALAMAATGRSPGSGSALVGVFQFGCAFLVSSLVAAFQNGTAYPMTVAIALCATTAMSVRIVFGRKVIAQ
jgi:Arabinose efflux permease